MQISGANLLLASQRPSAAQQPFRPAAFDARSAAASPAKAAGKAQPSPESTHAPGVTTRPGSQVNILI